ncbi:reverse transcriptase domain-containing protein [Flavobacterium difficile]|uniref:Reverse transcriptase domain-containing protein n=1 Tax=Flavobacterium difficile TaxID=2709659 RepID=A0ABX0I3C7_9FLAO|nr:reverse transcriptase domain-containing protein [Flavobacterium difficile]NHM01686.1 hypothetical protein [Flavobacterium difficile]
MGNLSDYFNEEEIVKLLCGYRSKYSHKRHKLHMMRDISLHKNTNKIEVKGTNPEFEILQNIFPSRRNWVSLNEYERKKYNDSIKRASARLFKTYKFYKKKNIPLDESADWYKNLIDFVSSLIERFNDTGNYKMGSPKIFGILKKADSVKCEYRPIALYELVDRIISSLTARYLTDFFDPYFLNCSFAFRSTKRDIKYTHHKSIEEIINYRKQNKDIWVSECDIQKFFDAVNQNHIYNVFLEHVEKIKQSHNREIDNRAILIFKTFLSSFAFNKDVFPKNDDSDWWAENNLKDGFFKWIEKSLIEEYGEKYLENRIGVPQGNAISCFISNLLLHNVDENVLKFDDGVFYVRFCDDMILMHKNKDTCKEALEVYKNTLKENFLSYHTPTECNNYLDKTSNKKFWKSKSKEPYLWDNPKEDSSAIPWLSFVGYQIKYNSEIRVRKQSIKKEKKKIVKEVENVLTAIAVKQGNVNETSRKSKNQIIFSTQNRLNSMSVGRIELHNYKTSKQGLCWTNGFEMIKENKNKYICKQLKELDSYREKQIWRLSRQIDELRKESHKPDPEVNDEMFFGSPFSYYNYLNKHEILD